MASKALWPQQKNCFDVLNISDETHIFQSESFFTSSMFEVCDAMVRDHNVESVHPNSVVTTFFTEVDGLIHEHIERQVDTIVADGINNMEKQIDVHSAINSLRVGEVGSLPSVEGELDPSLDSSILGDDSLLQNEDDQIGTDDTLGDTMVRGNFDDSSRSLSMEEQTVGGSDYISSYTKEEDDRAKEPDGHPK